ncbi:MAG: hypothetical protein M3042_04175 [Actinomycetota bacterium]|nr:hypothetical protein [Actinomycetota bacterium]
MKQLVRRAVVLPAVVGAAALFLAGGAILLPGHNAPAGSSVVDSSSAGSPAGSRDPLIAGLERTQGRLRQEPGNADLWATLGSAYLQVGRITADPTYYPKAQAAFARSLTLQAARNVAAMAGMGQLAAARHDFARALRWGHQALAVDAYSTVAYGVVADAATQLGDYPGARAAIQRMLDLKPGVSSFTRGSYDLEIHGDVGAARAALNRALVDSLSPADVAFCRYYLGELSFNSGDASDAAAQYAQGLRADPSNTQLLAGRARLEAIRGQRAAALADYTAVTERVPLPQYVLEFGDFLTSIGRAADAARQYALLRTEQQLFASNGVLDDLLSAEFDADHGNPAGALRHAEAEWSRRHSVLVADALAWALHKNGRNSEALRLAAIANRLGWRNATFAYHRGMIESALGQRAAARVDLTEALRINPNFSFLQAPIARRALASLTGQS